MKYQSIIRRTTVSIIWSISPNLYEYALTIKIEIHLPYTQHTIESETIYQIISILLIKNAM